MVYYGLADVLQWLIFLKLEGLKRITPTRLTTLDRLERELPYFDHFKARALIRRNDVSM